MTKISNGVERKVCNADSGLSTMGCPAMLNEVLRSTGTPLICSKYVRSL